MAVIVELGPGDPFVQRGVFGKVDIRGFTKTMGSWS